MDIATLQAHLEAERRKLEADLKSIAQHDEQTGDWVAIPIADDLQTADENLEADAVEQWQERRATVSQLETSHRNVMRALAKITSGTYGMCEISGEPIEPERLAVNPSARTCIAHRDEERTLPQ